MPFLDWDNSFNIGVEDLDKQHMKLLELMNELHDAMMCGKENTVLDSILAELTDYTKYHFTFEEGLMDKSDYPQSEEHKAKHEKLKAKLFEIQAEYHARRVGLNTRVMDFLQNWLVRHILGDNDMELGAYLSSRS